MGGDFSMLRQFQKRKEEEIRKKKKRRKEEGKREREKKREEGKEGRRRRSSSTVVSDESCCMLHHTGLKRVSAVRVGSPRTHVSSLCEAGTVSRGTRRLPWALVLDSNWFAKLVR